MANVDTDLLYEILKSIQKDVSQVKVDVREAKDELRAIRGHLHATQQDVANIYATLYRQDEQFDRINRRLELSDKPH